MEMLLRKEEKTDVLSNSSFFHNPKLYVNAYKQQNRPINLPTSLSSLHPMIGILRRRKVSKGRIKRKAHILNGPPPGSLP